MCSCRDNVYNAFMISTMCVFLYTDNDIIKPFMYNTCTPLVHTKLPTCMYVNKIVTNTTTCVYEVEQDKLA